MPYNQNRKTPNKTVELVDSVHVVECASEMIPVREVDTAQTSYQNIGEGEQELVELDVWQVVGSFFLLVNCSLLRVMQNSFPQNDHPKPEASIHNFDTPNLPHISQVVQHSPLIHFSWNNCGHHSIRRQSVHRVHEYHVLDRIWHN